MHEEEIPDVTNEEPADDASDEMLYEETDESGHEQHAGAKMKDLRKQLVEAKRERDEYLVGWQKAKADYINLQKESEKARVSMRSHMRKENVYELLPVIDSFQMAMAGEAWESVESNWRVGVEYIYQQLWKVMEEYGVSEIQDTNIPFEPQLHEPMEIETITDESQNDQVLAIIQKGYRMGDTIIRPAKVKVGKLAD